jgi:opacity protein-like surface antigen
MLHQQEQQKSNISRLHRAIAGTFLILLLLASPLFAHEEADTSDGYKRFHLGFKLFGSSDFGVSVNPVFSLELSLGGAAHETSDPRIDATLGMFQIFAKYRFAPGQDFRPYIKGGLGGYELRLEEQNVSASINGGGLAFGGGFDYFFTPHFSLGMDITHNVINYEEFNFSAGGFSVGMEIDEEGSMTSLGLNLTAHF